MHVDEYQQGFGHLGAEEALKVIMVENDHLRDLLVVNDAVLDELDRQNARWGVQNHPDVSPALVAEGDRDYYQGQADLWKGANAYRVSSGLLAWDGILLEEVYEALAESDPDKLEAELIQVAAVAQQWVAAIRRRNRA